MRDIVFDAVRQRRSALARAGGGGGRALVLGVALNRGALPEGWNGEGHAPAPLTAAEAGRLGFVPDPADLRDLPDWLWQVLDASLGADAERVAEALRHRAPIHLRVNRARASVDQVRGALAAKGIGAEPVEGVDTALSVITNPRKIKQSRPFLDGWIEMQDAASQALALAFARAVPRGARVLDYCAGGGGKSLALAAEGLSVSAHDKDLARMSDIPLRAERAGARVEVLKGAPRGTWAGVLVDAPCSGSGSWRRAPEAKWTLTPQRLDELARLQASILDTAQGLVAPGGVLAYATCSVFAAENGAQVAGFVARHKGWACVETFQTLPGPGGDGFFFARFTRR